VTADAVMGFDDPTDLTIAHALYKRFVLGDASFQYAGVKIDGLSREKIRPTRQRSRNQPCPDR